MGLQEEIAKKIEKLESSRGKWIKIDYRPASGGANDGYVWHRYGQIKGKLYLKIDDIVIQENIIIIKASESLLRYDSYKYIWQYTDDEQPHRIKMNRVFKFTNPNISLAFRNTIRSKFE